MACGSDRVLRSSSNPLFDSDVFRSTAAAVKKEKFNSSFAISPPSIKITISDAAISPPIPLSDNGNGDELPVDSIGCIEVAEEKDLQAELPSSATKPKPNDLDSICQKCHQSVAADENARIEHIFGHLSAVYDLHRFHCFQCPFATNVTERALAHRHSVDDQKRLMIFDVVAQDCFPLDQSLVAQIQEVKEESDDLSQQQLPKRPLTLKELLDASQNNNFAAQTGRAHFDNDNQQRIPRHLVLPAIRLQEDSSEEGGDEEESWLVNEAVDLLGERSIAIDEQQPEESPRNAANSAPNRPSLPACLTRSLPAAGNRRPRRPPPPTATKYTDVDIVRRWAGRLSQLLARLTPGSDGSRLRVHCAAEIAMAADVGRKARLYTRDNDDNEDANGAVKVFFCVSASGDRAPPLILYDPTPTSKKKKEPLSAVPEAWCRNGPSDALCALTPGGWLTKAKFQAWLKKIFFPYVTRKNKKTKTNKLKAHVLLLDAYCAPWISAQCKEEAKAANVHFFPFLAGGKLVQPFDVILKTSLKRNWRSVVRRWHREPLAEGKKKCVKRAFSRLLRETLVEKDGLNGELLVDAFRQTGLAPFDRRTIEQMASDKRANGQQQAITLPDDDNEGESSSPQEPRKKRSRKTV